jgi:hypothetical protein
MRHLVPTLSFACCVAFGLAAACTVGEPYATGSGGGGGGGGGGGDGDDPDAAVGDVDCDPGMAAGLDSGNHNPGLTCIAAGCHDGNTEDAPPWTVAGTLYSSIAGDAPVPGATIRLVDGGGTELTLITAQNGNFYTEDPVTFPLTVKASKCPDTLAMVASVAQSAPTGVSCNTGGCHDSAINRIHLP